MGLQDEHLRKALRNAPDSDAAPNDATRRQVLDYAANASKQASARSAAKPSWLQSGLNRIWQNINSWPAAAVSSAMTAVLVVVVFWDQQPDQPVFSTNESDQMDMAQAEQAPQSVDEYFYAETISNNAPTKAITAKRRKAVEKEQMAKAKKNDMPAIDDVVTSAVAPEAEVVEERLAGAPPVLERENVFEMADKQLAEVARKDVKPKVIPSEEMPEIAGQKEAKVAIAEKDADAEVGTDVSGRIDSPRKESADTVIAANEKNKAKLEGAAKRASTTVAAAPVTIDKIAQARVRGNANALKDIAAGNFRIVALANTKLNKSLKKKEVAEDVGLEDSTIETGKTIGSGTLEESTVTNDTLSNTVDDVTGYRVEVLTDRSATEAVKAEIEAYNASMRAHYQKQINKNQ